MFYLSSLTREISIFPKDLRKNTTELISNEIKSLEGSVIGDRGYILSIIEFNQVSKGKIDNETGRVNYKIMYKAITFRPCINEILFVMPVFINEHGFFCKIGHLQIFVSQYLLKDKVYDPNSNSWNGKNDSIKIGDKVKVRIINFRINFSEITALAEIY